MSGQKETDIKPGTLPKFCFICGSKLEEAGLGYFQCVSEDCGEMYLPYLGKENNQCIMHIRTPFSPK